MPREKSFTRSGYLTRTVTRGTDTGPRMVIRCWDGWWTVSQRAITFHFL